MKKLLTVISAIISIFLFGAGIHAESGDYGQAEIAAALPDNALGYLAENEIFSDNSGALNLTVGGVLGDIWEAFRNEVTKPLQMLMSLLGVIFICALLKALRDGNDGAAGAFNIVCVLAGAGVMCGFLGDCIDNAAATLSAVSVFMLTYIPVFAGIIAVSGHAASAVVYNSVVLVAVQLISQLTVTFLVPLSGSILGVSVAGAVNPELNIHKAADAVRKVIVWVMSLLMTIFVGILSVQTFVAASADSVTLRAARFAVSSAVPIVGGAVSEALTTVKGSIGILKSSTGSFGIIAAAVIMLPTLISVISYKLALMLAAAASELFGAEALTPLLKSAENVLTILTAMLCCFFVLLTVSTAIMLIAGRGGV